MGFGPTQTTEAEQAQLGLEVADVVLAQGQVVKQVACAVQMQGVDGFQTFLVSGFMHQQGRLQVFQLGDQL